MGERTSRVGILYLVRMRIRYIRCSINYIYIRIPRASERRDSIAPSPPKLDRANTCFFAVYFHTTYICTYTKCGQCIVLDYMSTAAVRIRLYARARSIASYVRGRRCYSCATVQTRIEVLNVKVHVF